MLNLSTPVKWSLALALASTTFGCGAFKTKDNGDKARENNSDLAADWIGQCTPSSFLNIGYMKEEFKFSAVGDFDKMTTLYKDSACATQLITLTQHGVYADLKTSATVSGANDINFQINDDTVTAHSADAVNVLNDANYCGVSTWAANAETDVLGKSCLGKTFAKGETTYDVYRLDNNNSRLVFGKGALFLTGAAATDRPSKLDDSNPFAKQ